MLKELENIDIKNKERYLNLFRDLMEKIKSGNYNFRNEKGEDYYIINEDDRKGSRFVHIVPKELLRLFNKVKENYPDEFLGFTILINNTRVSCFGIPCSELSKVIINKNG